MNAFSFKRFSQALTAGQILRIYVGQFDYLILMSNTGANDTVKVSVNGQEFQTLSVGLKIITSEKYEYIDIQNTDSITATFVLYIGNGDIDNTAFAVGATLPVKQVATSIVSTSISAVTGAGGTTYTPNTSAVEIHVYNPDTTKEVWYGDASVDPASNIGTPIKPQEKVVIACAGALRFRSQTSATTIAINELRSA